MIADPYVYGGIKIDNCPSFLIIMSDGLYQALIDGTGSDMVNVEIARMVASEFSVQSTLNGVAQAVVDKVVRIHHDAFMVGSPDIKQRCQKRGDITLLVRNFNYPLANAISSPTASGAYSTSVPFYQPRPNNLPNLSVPTHLPITPVVDLDITDIGSAHISGGTTPTPTTTPPKDTFPTASDSSNQETQRSASTSTSTNSTQSSGETRFPSRYYHRAKLDLDADGRIEAYIDFSEFYKAIEDLTDSQRESLNAEIKPKPAYEPISEEGESLSAPEN